MEDYHWTAFFTRILICGWIVIAGCDWCERDSGYTTVADSNGEQVRVYVSLTRDGSVWLRVGKDQNALDWAFSDEQRFRYQGSILTPDEAELLRHINYTDYCVLTDIDMKVKAVSGWHPTYVVVFDPRTKTSSIAVMKHQKDCHASTTFRLSDDKQGLTCDGMKKNVCGQRLLPDKGRTGPTMFLKDVSFDPTGHDNWMCSIEPPEMPPPVNSYTFTGSYYYAYVKVAQCDPPKATRSLGHDATFRPQKDDSSNVIVITDPTQAALGDDVIVAWRVFVKVISLEHEVYLQVWRPEDPIRKSGVVPILAGTSQAPASARNQRPYLSSSGGGEMEYRLVGQTLFHPKELRFHEIRLPPGETISVRRGDVLGLYHPRQNPLPWSSVPCASRRQTPRYAVQRNDDGGDGDMSEGGVESLIRVGRTLRFARTGLNVDSGGEVRTLQSPSCRRYSFTAIFSNTSSSLVEDWSCPRRSGSSFLGGRVGGRGSDGARTRSSSHDYYDEDDELSSAIQRDSQAGDGVDATDQSSAALGWFWNNFSADMPLNILLAIIGCLILLLFIVGAVSYYAAIRL